MGLFLGVSMAKNYLKPGNSTLMTVRTVRIKRERKRGFLPEMCSSKISHFDPLKFAKFFAKWHFVSQLLNGETKWGILNFYGLIYIIIEEKNKQRKREQYQSKKEGKLNRSFFQWVEIALLSKVSWTNFSKKLSYRNRNCKLQERKNIVLFSLVLI